MENPLLSPDILRLAKLSEADAQAELFEKSDDSSDPVLRPDAAAIIARRISTRMQQERTDKLGEGIRKRSQEIERVAKPLFERLGIQAENLIDGLNALSEKLSEDDKHSPTNLNDEEVVKHPRFRNALKERLAEAQKEFEDLKAQFEQFKAQVELEKVDNYIIGQIESILAKKNAVFAPNRAAQIKYFFKALPRQYFQVAPDTGTIELVDEQGLALRGDDKRTITFEDYIVKQWQELGYGFNEANPSPPNPGGSGDKTHFTTSAAVAEALKKLKPTDITKKAELLARMAELIRAGK